MPILAPIVAFVATAITDVSLAGGALGGAIGGAVGGVAGSIAGTVIGESLGAALGFGLVIEGVATASNLLLGSQVGQDGGTQVNFMANPQAGVPYAIGRTGTAGTIVFVDSAGDNSKYMTYVSVASLGPTAKSESFQANTISVIFDADNGEGAGHQNTLTSTQGPNAIGATVIQVGDATAFSNGQNITIGGIGYTIANVYPGPKELQLRSGLTAAVPIYTAVEGPTVTSGFVNRMWLKTQLGEPSSPYLTFTSTNSKDTPANHSGIPSVWTANCQLSGLAARMWTLEYDAQVYSGGTPGPMEVVQGVFCYDPRQDSTYPGGSGACRSNDETTWIYSENPFVHAITWLIGRTSNGVKTMGVHAPIAAIDMPAFVTGANVADANGWRVGGVIYSTDKKWDVLVAMLQAGSGTPLKLGAKISCMVNTPMVSLDTLTGADVVGSASIATTTASRDRINAVWPRYREEQQGWQIVPTQTIVTVPAYIAIDGGQRTRETEYKLVQSATQASVLAAYDIQNAREISPISLACKPRWMGYKPGDCITINEPEYGLAPQKVLLLSREVEPATLVTTLGFRSETDSKHPFALGQTNTAPVTPSVQGFDPSVFAGPQAGAWTATGGLITSGGTTVPVINIAGAVDNALAAAVIVQYSPAGLNDWTAWTEANAATTAIQITGLAPGAYYDVQISYRSVKGVISAGTVITPAGGVETGGLTVTNTANVGTATAGQIQTLPATVSQNTADITNYSLIVGATAALMQSQTTYQGQPVNLAVASLVESVNGLQGAITLSVNSNGQVTGLDFGTSGLPNSGYFDILTGRFRLIDTTSGQTLIPLSYTSGVGWVFNSNVAINGNLIISGSITTAAIDPGAITNTTYTEGPPSGSGSLGAVGSSAVNIGSLTLTTSGAPLRIEVDVQINNTDESHDALIELTLQRDATQVSDPFYCFVRQNTSHFSGGQPGSEDASFYDAGATAGSHTYTVYAQYIGGVNSGVAIAQFCRIIIQDLKTEA